MPPTAPRPPRILWPRRPRRAAPVGRLLRERSNRLSGRDAGETRVCRDNVQPLRTASTYSLYVQTNSTYRQTLRKSSVDELAILLTDYTTRACSPALLRCCCCRTGPAATTTAGFMVAASRALSRGDALTDPCVFEGDTARQRDRRGWLSGVLAPTTRRGCTASSNRSQLGRRAMRRGRRVEREARRATGSRRDFITERQRHPVATERHDRKSTALRISGCQNEP